MSLRMTRRNAEGRNSSGVERSVPPSLHPSRRYVNELGVQSQSGIRIPTIFYFYAGILVGILWWEICF